MGFVGKTEFISFSAGIENLLTEFNPSTLILTFLFIASWFVTFSL